MKLRIFLIITSLFLTQSLFGETKASAQHISAELVSEKASIKPGENINIGIILTMEPQWHVYWQNPGDSGEAPRIIWNIPLDVKAGEIQWPVPKKIIVGPLADYGYEKEVLLVSTFQIPNFISEKPFEIKAKVKWLVCREVCIPGSADLDLLLPVTNSEPIMGPAHELFESTRKSYPQPIPNGWKINTSSFRDFFKIKIIGGEAFKTAYFFPLHPLQIDNFSNQQVEDSQLTVKKSEQAAKDPQFLEGILKVDDKNYTVKAAVVVSSESAPLYLMLFFAFLGGLLLNLMPCVFPVLSMKILGFLKKRGGEQKKIRTHALVYMLGILFSFWILVGVLLLLKAGGEHLGWGFQLQSPPFVAALAAILFLFGLNLVGVFEIGGSIMGVGNSLTRHEGFIGDFFTGVFATIVSTPCTAPFMGSAVGFALSQNIFITFLIFTSLALGLAAPYVFLAYNPTVGKLLPKPGPWMETLKQVTAFLIFATVVWLISVVAQQTPSSFVITLIGSLFLMGLAAWLLHRWPQKKCFRFLALGIIIFSVLLVVLKHENPKEALNWEDFSPSKIESYKSSGKAVFVDFTAAWCISCKVNELIVFNSDAVKEKIKQHNVVLLRADWTSHDAVITQSLADLGRSGIPTYAIFEGDKEPVLLPEVITPGIVISALDKLK